MYESPITLYTTALNTQIEKDTLNIISNYGIDVDKDELIKALRYDRAQYEKGYADGMAAAAPIRCRECRYLGLLRGGQHHCKKFMIAPDALSPRIFHDVEPDHFCSYGERRNET